MKATEGFRWEGNLIEAMPFLKKYGITKFNYSMIDKSLRIIATDKDNEDKLVNVFVQVGDWVIGKPDGTVDIVPDNKIKFNK